MFKRLSVAAVFALPLSASLLVSCTGMNSGLVSASGEDIVNGTVVTEMSDVRSSTVMLYKINADKSASLCTGTLIAKDIILTAAHCAPKESDSRILVGYGNDLQSSFAKSRTLPVGVVSRFLVNDKYKADSVTVANAANDIALYKFVGEIPENFAPRELPSADFKIEATDVLHMIGFGVTTERAGDAGLLRETETSAGQITETVHLEKSNADLSIPGSIIVKQPETGVCTGDSGGPLFVKRDDKVTLVGVVSMGLDNSESEERRTCHGVSLFLDVRTQLTWIKDNIEQLNK